VKDLWLINKMHGILNGCETHHLIVGVLLKEYFGPIFPNIVIPWLFQH
jgi:hypothetical protein